MHRPAMTILVLVEAIVLVGAVGCATDPSPTGPIFGDQPREVGTDDSSTDEGGADVRADGPPDAPDAGADRDTGDARSDG